MVHGSDDPDVALTDARALADAATGPSELHVVLGAGHWLRADPRVIALLVGWLERRSLTPAGGLRMRSCAHPSRPENEGRVKQGVAAVHGGAGRGRRGRQSSPGRRRADRTAGPGGTGAGLPGPAADGPAPAGEGGEGGEVGEVMPPAAR